jgi:HK97 gp10 family phage protein
VASIEFDGSELNSFSASFHGVVDEVAAKVVLATRKSAADIKRDAMILAPFDTGFLKGSITYDTTISANAIEAEIGPTAEYGVWLEEGTSTMAPHAFMGPAFDRNEGYYAQALSSILGDI